MLPQCFAFGRVDDDLRGRGTQATVSGKLHHWDLRVRRDVAPIYVHILFLEESWCGDAGFDDNSSRSSSFVYAIKLEVGAPFDSNTGG
jgi:hypothetical protein